MDEESEERKVLVVNLSSREVKESRFRELMGSEDMRD